MQMDIVTVSQDFSLCMVLACMFISLLFLSLSGPYLSSVLPI